MSAIRRAIMAQGSLVPFCDADGKQICTTLDDGVVLEWRNMAKQFSPSVYTDGGYTSMEMNGTEAILTIVTTHTNNRKGYLLRDLKPDSFYVSNFDILANHEGNAWINIGFISGDVVSATLNSYKRIGFFKKINADSDYLRFYHSTNNYAIGDQYKMKNPMLFEISSMFEKCQSYIPSSYYEFYAMFWSEGSTELGYNDYTEEPTEVIVKGGKLWIA